MQDSPFHVFFAGTCTGGLDFARGNMGTSIRTVSVDEVWMRNSFDSFNLKLCELLTALPKEISLGMRVPLFYGS